MNIKVTLHFSRTSVECTSFVFIVDFVAKNAILGEGEYGMVYRGFLHGDAVAVKTTKPNPDVAYFKALLGEIKIMAYIGKHENVVEFKGAVTEKIRESKWKHNSNS